MFHENIYLIHTNFLTMISILLLQKSIYPYEYMHDWEKFDETSLPEKEDFCSHLSRKNTTDAAYTHGKTVCKDFKI